MHSVIRRPPCGKQVEMSVSSNSSLSSSSGKLNNMKVNNNSSGGAPPSSRYKTELCRPFEEFGTCKYGDKCQFAHGSAELRRMTRHPKYKTEQCKTFHTLGLCPYGHRCHFIHNENIGVPSSRNRNNMILTSGGSTSSTASLSSSPSPPLSASPTGSFEDQLFDQTTHQQQFSPRLPIFSSFFPQQLE